MTVPGSQPVEFKYDLPRAVRFIVYATFIGTPLAHLWFGVLDDVSGSQVCGQDSSKHGTRQGAHIKHCSSADGGDC